MNDDYNIECVDIEDTDDKENENSAYEIEYESGLKHSYMVLRNVSVDFANFEWKMLLNAGIPMILPVRMFEQDNKKVLQYDFAGKQTIENRYRENYIPYEDICVLIESIDNLLIQLEEYLMSEDSVLLKPGTIFYDYEHKDFCFCLLPGGSGGLGGLSGSGSAPDHRPRAGARMSFSESLKHLLAWVLEKIDYDSDQSVILAYTLFRECNRESFQMDDLIRIVRRKKRTRETGHGYVTGEKQGEIYSRENGRDESRYSKDSAYLSKDGVFRLPEENIYNTRISSIPNVINNTANTANTANNANNAYNVVNNAIEKASNDRDNIDYGSYIFPAKDAKSEDEDQYFDPGFDLADYAEDITEDNENPDEKSEAKGFIASILKRKRAKGNGEMAKSEKEASKEDSKEDLDMKELSEIEASKIFKRKLALGISLMICLPLALWFLKGPDVFRRLWMVIAILETGIVVILILDYMMSRAEED